MKNDQQTYVPDPEVASRLLEWYGREGRDLPWRRTRDPYRIWISEVILQQTRVAQGMSYYHRFLELFLDVAALASAPEDLVLKCWQGLGYYSRARNLLAAARRIVETHGGVFPTDYADVRALPGWATIRLRRSVRSPTTNPVPHSTAMSFGCFPAFTTSIRPSIRLSEGGRSLRWPIR